MNSASRIVQTNSQWLIVDVDHDRAGDRAQHEPDGDRQHVDDDDVLERTGVERLQRRGRRPATTPNRQPSAKAPASATAPMHRRRAERRRHRQRAGRNRPPALQRMLPVALAIRDVVDQIDDAGQRAEDRRTPAIARSDRGRIEQLARANSRPAKTSRFFVHWPGRSEMSRLTRSDRRPTLRDAAHRGIGSRRTGNVLRAI